MNDASSTSDTRQMPGATDRPARADPAAQRWKPMVTVLIAAFVVRGVAMWEARHAELVLDEQLYVLRANALLDGKGFVGSYQSWVRHPESPYLIKLPQYPGAYQPPAYAVFLAAVMGVTGRSILAAKAAQVLLSTLTVLLVYSIGRSWFDRRQGLIAAWFCALYPNLIAFSHYFWTETFFLFLLVAAVWLLTRGKSAPGLAACLLAGLLLGLAALTRSVILYFMPLLLVWLVVVHRARWRPALGGAVAILVVMAATILPWTIRNYRLYGGFVLIDTNGPFNLWRGNDPTTFAFRQSPAVPKYRPPFEGIPLNPVGPQTALQLTDVTKERLGIPDPTDLQVMACARQLALECIQADFRGFLGRAWLKLVDLWNPTSFLVRHLWLGAYGPVDPAIEWAITWAAIISYVLMMILGVIGWCRYWHDGRAWLVLLLVLYFTGIHAVTFGLTRFRLPLMPFIILLAAHAVGVAYDALWRADDQDQTAKAVPA